MHFGQTWPCCSVKFYAASTTPPNLKKLHEESTSSQKKTSLLTCLCWRRSSKTQGASQVRTVNRPRPSYMGRERQSSLCDGSALLRPLTSWGESYCVLRSKRFCVEAEQWELYGGGVVAGGHERRHSAPYHKSKCARERAKHHQQYIRSLQ